MHHISTQLIVESHMHYSLPKPITVPNRMPINLKTSVKNNVISSSIQSKLKFNAHTYIYNHIPHMYFIFPDNNVKLGKSVT